MPRFTFHTAPNGEPVLQVDFVGSYTPDETVHRLMQEPLAFLEPFVQSILDELLPYERQAFKEALYKSLYSPRR